MVTVRRTAATLVAGIVCLLLASAAGADERHSGRVVAVDDTAALVVIDEVGPWRVHNGMTQTTRLAVTVTPSTRIVSHIRVNIPGRFEGDFIEVALDLADVTSGDFVTVECRREDGRLVASSMAIAEVAPAMIR